MADEKERGTNDGDRWSSGSMECTANSALDSRVQGDGYYLTVVDHDTGEKSTIVYNEDGSLADVPANRDYE